MTIYAQLDTTTLQKFDGPVAGTFFDHGGSEINVLHPAFVPTYSSSDPTVVTNGSAVLQAAFDLAAANGGVGTIRIPGGYTFVLESDVVIDSTLTSAVGISVDARNARFAVHGIGRVGIKRLSAQFPNSGTLNFRFRWTGGYFYSDDNAAGQTGIQFSAGYNCVFREIDFVGLDTGLDMIMLLNTLVESCMASNCATYGFRARSGDELSAWRATGGPNGVANAVNAQCNSTVFSKCRVYAKADSHSCYYITGSSGCVVRESIAEGASPQYAVYFDHAGLRPLDPNDPGDARLNPTVKDFTVSGLHCENNPPASDALIYVRLIGQVWLDKVWHQGAGPTCLVECASDTPGGSLVIIGDWPGFLPGGTVSGNYFQRGSANWEFRGMLGSGYADLGASTTWKDGLLPTYWYARRLSSSTELGGSYLTIDGSRVWTKANQLVGGALEWAPHNTLDLGFSGLNSKCPKGIYAGTEVKAPALNATTSLQIAGGTAIGGHKYGGFNPSPAIGAITGPDTTTFDFTLSGASVGDKVEVAPQAGLGAGFLVGNAFVVSADTVRVTLAKISAGSATPSAVTWRFNWWKHA
jgi:hypothetical protein